MSRNSITNATAGTIVQADTIGHLTVRSANPDRPRQLPPPVRGFVGRVPELSSLDRTDAGLVVVEGLAGAGKTALVTTWAHRNQYRFPDGTLFVDLRGHGPAPPLPPAIALSTMLTGLGYATEDIPTTTRAQTNLLRTHCATRRVLVVLDDAHSPEQVRPLLPGADGCLTIVTGRVGLRGLCAVDGAIPIRLGTLPQSDAVALVRSALPAAAARPTALLASLCGGLPLALRIAATWAAGHGHHELDRAVADFANSDRLTFLSTPGDRVTSIRAVFDASYRRLAAIERFVFRRLGLHPSVDFGIPAVVALTRLDRHTVAAALASLVAANLVDAAARDRYRMHDLVHAYAVDRVTRDEPASDTRAATAHLVEWYAATADAADRTAFPRNAALDHLPAQALPGVDRSAALAWLGVETHNLLACQRLAHRSGMWTQAVRLAGGCRFLTLLPRPLWRLRLEAECLGLRSAVAARDQRAEAVLLVRRADTWQELGQWGNADRDLGRALLLGQEQGDFRRVYEALCGLGYSHRAHKRYREAIDHYRRALPLTRYLGDVRSEAVVESNLGAILVALGRHRQALAHFDREQQLRGVVGHPGGQASPLLGAALAWQRMGEHDRAVCLGTELLARFGRSVPPYLLVDVHSVLAVSQAATGDSGGALRSLRAAVAVMVQTGDPRAADEAARLRTAEAEYAAAEYAASRNARRQRNPAEEPPPDPDRDRPG